MNFVGEKGLNNCMLVLNLKKYIVRTLDRDVTVVEW